MKRVIIVIICVMAVGLFAVPQASADKNEAANYLVEIGMRHYQRGQIDEAIHEISKALLIDPENRRAIAELKKMGINHRIYTGAKTKESELVDLARHVRNYKDQLATLMQEKQVLEKKLNEVLLERDTLTQKQVAKDLEVDLMQVKLDETARIIGTEREIQLRQLEQIEEMYLSKIDQLRHDADYKTSMTFKELLVLREQELRDKEEHFMQVNGRLTRAVEQLIQYEDRLKEIDEFYFDLKSSITTKRAIDVDMLTLLEDNIGEQRSMIEDLKDELIFNAFDIGSKNALLDRQAIR